MNIFIVTYLNLDGLGRIEFQVDKAFKDEEEAFQYLREQNLVYSDRINYEVHEVTLEDTE